MVKFLLDKLSSMLQERGGDTAWSSVRFAFIFSVLLSNTVIFVSLLVLVISDTTFPDIPEGVLWLYALANGISFAGKITQKFKENTNNETKSDL